MRAAAAPLPELARELTENGLDFLERAVAEMRSPTVNSKSLKFAIVDLAVAVEVLMKARLVREHWTLICVNPDKTTTAEVQQGSARTVTPEQAVSRLENAAGINMKSAGHAARIARLFELRNRADHFSTAGADLTALQVCLSGGLTFLLRFLGSEFRGQPDADVEELVEASLETLTTQLGKLELLRAERMANIQDDLMSAELCLECPRCSLPTLMIVQGQTAQCAFCLWKPLDGTECADEYVGALLDTNKYVTISGGEIWPVSRCVSCFHEAMVEGIQPVPTPQDSVLTAENLRCDPTPPAYYACFSCGMNANEYELAHCARCDEVTERTSDSGVSMCSECCSELMLRG